MAKKVRIEINSDGVRELLQSQEMMNVCKGYADRALAQLGSGYEVTTLVGRTRVNAEVATASYRAMRENLKSNTILKAMGSL